MKTTIHIKYAVLVIRMIIIGIAGFFRNLYKTILFVRATSILKKWPEDIKIPLVIAAIENE